MRVLQRPLNTSIKSDLLLTMHLCALVVLSLWSFSLFASPDTRYESSQSCKGCHLSQYDQWQSSHHAKAMQLPSESTVLADFNDSQAQHFAQEATFFKKGDAFYATVKDSRGEQTFKVAYTFGYFPLQQYLVATEKGRMQVLPFAWDTRDKQAGGQRWMHLYLNEAIAFNDRLHWQQPLQNWNGMCADCHSDGLKRNYSTLSNTFKTEYKERNVGCLSCHDDKAVMHGQGLAEDDQTSVAGFWQRSAEQDVASWTGSARDTSYEDTCYACHSLRSPLTDGFDSLTAYLDQFSPNLLTPPLYYADGQIKEEVYVMGSFKQSKMAQKGVTCIDCHDPHTYELKAKGNGTCLQCHSAQTFQTTQHHGHPMPALATENTGTQCVDCHMPKTSYMNVDARGDHSFKIPRPEFTISSGIPNACNACHEDQTPQWALKQIEAWHPDRTGPTASEHMFLNLFDGLDYQNILRLANNKDLAPIKRATAISALQYVQFFPAQDISVFLRADEPLLRLAAAQVAERLTSQEKQTYLAPLLSDEYRAIRVAAAYSMLGVSFTQQVAQKWQRAFENAFAEMVKSQDLSSWRGEGRMQQALSARKVGQARKEEEAYRLSIYIDPYYAPAYINLTELYRQRQQFQEAEEIYQQGMKNIPDSALFRYSYALHFIRNKALDDALKQVNAALAIEPNNAQFAYLYYLILDSQGKRQQAIQELKNSLNQYDNSQQLGALLRNWGG